jgi:uncharacterized protein
VREETALVTDQFRIDHDGSRPAAPAPIGRVLTVGGSSASIRVAVPDAPHDGESADSARVTVGKFLGLYTGQSLVIGVITTMSIEPAGVDTQAHASCQVDLLGEIKQDERGTAFFQRGVTSYPAVGDPVDLIAQDELRLVFDTSGPNTITIGQLQQDASVAAYVNVDEMVRKHFAVLGTTGVGKSSGVALLIRKTLDARPDLRIFLVDPHNEYGHSFDQRAQVLNPKNLKLPFWLFNFEETVDVFYRGRPGIEEEVAVLSEVIPIAKANFAASRTGDRLSLRRNDPKGTGFTVDTPVPYRLEELINLIDQRMGKLENRSAWTNYHRLMTRIETARNDPRYSFMFDNANVGGDTMLDVICQLFRLPPDGKPMTIMQLAGFPAEVVDSVVSVLCRMAFEFGLWSDGAFPMLMVCEEAHRYAPADRTLGFGPTRKAVSRIAKEGRKYGVFLGLVTQRPAELDATIISQCSTLFVMRMANDRDQAIVRAAVSDAAASLLGFVPSLGTREVFAFGEGVALPTRLRFGELEARHIPRSEAVNHPRSGGGQIADRDFVASVIERWRGATMSKIRSDEPLPEFDPLEAAGPAELANAPSVDPDRFGKWSKPVSTNPESFAFPVEGAAGPSFRGLRK